jgi:CheY-like chemotaxis protein
MLASSRPTVLVVDDSAEARELLAFWVRSLGYCVNTAATGEAALEVVDQHLPDLILLDVLLPGLNGFEVCERLKAKAPTRAIPIVLISGLRHPENVRRGRALGASHFLLKPFDEGELTQVLHAALLEHRGGRRSALRVPAGPVLVVEDDQQMLRFVAEALAHVGVRVVTAENGLEALDQLRRHRPCLIMLDLALPLLDGSGFVAAARNDPELPMVPVVCLSGLPDAARRAEELGAVECLTKPIDPDTLLGVVLRHAAAA